MFRVILSLTAACVVTSRAFAQPCELGWDTSIGNPGLFLDEERPASVYSMLVHDDGNGEALFVGGQFTSAGGVAAEAIARWDGNGWSSLGIGLNVDSYPFPYNARVRALASLEDSTGPALYVGGDFVTAGGVPAMNVARWKDGEWSELGSGLGAPSDGVHALVVFDDGNGPALYAGGEFYLGGAPHHIARWTGSNWAPLGGGLDSIVYSLAVYDDGSGPALFAGGGFGAGVLSKGLAKWDGQAWVRIAGGQPRFKVVHTPRCRRRSEFCWAFTHPSVHAMTVFDDGVKETLVIGGSFHAISNLAVRDLAQWNGTKWFPLEGGVQLERIEALGVHDDGSGAAIYVGGFGFPEPPPGVARWNGRSWETLGIGLLGGAYSLASFDDGSGKALYVGGVFDAAGGMPAKNIARWKCMD